MPRSSSSPSRPSHHPYSSRRSQAAYLEKGNPSDTARQYICSVCKKAFGTGGHLSRHVKIHSGERRYACPFPGCETRTARADNLQQHFRIHLFGSRSRKSRSLENAVVRDMRHQSPPPIECPPALELTTLTVSHTAFPQTSVLDSAELFTVKEEPCSPPSSFVPLPEMAYASIPENDEWESHSSQEDTTDERHIAISRSATALAPRQILHHVFLHDKIDRSVCTSQSSEVIQAVRQNALPHISIELPTVFFPSANQEEESSQSLAYPISPNAESGHSSYPSPLCSMSSSQMGYSPSATYISEPPSPCLDEPLSPLTPYGMEEPLDFAVYPKMVLASVPLICPVPTRPSEYNPSQTSHSSAVTAASPATVYPDHRDVPYFPQQPSLPPVLDNDHGPPHHYLAAAPVVEASNQQPSVSIKAPSPSFQEPYLYAYAISHGEREDVSPLYYCNEDIVPRAIQEYHGSVVRQHSQPTLHYEYGETPWPPYPTSSTGTAMTVNPRWTLKSND